MRHFVFLVAGWMLLLPMTGHAQAKLEIQTHASIANGALGGAVDDKAGLGFLGGISYPLYRTSSGAESDLNWILKAGYNRYGEDKFLGDAVYRYSGIPFVSGIRLYVNNEQTIFFQIATGVEIQQVSHVRHKDDVDAETAWLGQVGLGAFVSRRVGVTGTYNISSGRWQYANIGVVFRF